MMDITLWGLVNGWRHSSTCYWNARDPSCHRCQVEELAREKAKMLREVKQHVGKTDFIEWLGVPEDDNETKD